MGEMAAYDLVAMTVFAIVVGWKPSYHTDKALSAQGIEFGTHWPSDLTWQLGTFDKATPAKSKRSSKLKPTIQYSMFNYNYFTPALPPCGSEILVTLMKVNLASEK